MNKTQRQRSSIDHERKLLRDHLRKMFAKFPELKRLKLAKGQMEERLRGKGIEINTEDDGS
jgi:hypothetical protein